MSIARLGARILIRASPISKSRVTTTRPVASCRLLSSASKKDDLTAVHVEDTRFEKSIDDDKASTTSEEGKSPVESASVDVDSDDEMEKEEMFVDPHESFEHKNVREWGGPRRGGRLPEPTRFGDWERKGRCTDF